MPNARFLSRQMKLKDSFDALNEFLFAEALHRQKKKKKKTHGKNIIAVSLFLFAMKFFFLLGVRLFFLPGGYSFFREVILLAVRFLFSVYREVILFAVRLFFLP